MTNITLIPPDMREYLVFLNSFIEPADFIKISARDRRKLIPKYREREIQPTETCYWIWFGAFSTKDGHPIFYNDRVTRHLYSILRTPLTPKRRIMNGLVETLADVNPFKYTLSCGTRYRRREGCSDDTKFRENLIETGITRIEENIESFPDIDQWDLVLQAFGIPITLHEEIKREYRKRKNNII